MPDDAYLDPYRAAVRRHGGGFEATLWGSEAAQRLRFDTMIDLAGIGEGVVVDVGCGRGDFAVRLVQRGVPFDRFVGLDALAEMVAAAREHVVDPRVAFEAADVVADPATLAEHAPDWVCFSGTLNTMDDATARPLIEAAVVAAGRGVAFNFLSDRCHRRWRDRALEPARRFDTVAWLDWALGLSSRVGFRQDYLDGHDATVVIWKDAD